jgi:hypothetical protein
MLQICNLKCFLRLKINRWDFWSSVLTDDAGSTGTENVGLLTRGQVPTGWRQIPNVQVQCVGSPVCAWRCIEILTEARPSLATQRIIRTTEQAPTCTSNYLRYLSSEHLKSKIRIHNKRQHNYN